MFGRNSNALKAMIEIQKIKDNGGKANISLSQVVCLICNSPDAKRNLNAEEYAIYNRIFSDYRRQSKCKTIDYQGYIDMCTIIIDSFEKHFPYLLIDGEHSKNLELRDQIKIRKLFNDGIKFKEALFKYENEYDSIPRFVDYDPIEQPKAKRIYTIMGEYVSTIVSQVLKTKADTSLLGKLLGALDAIYLLTFNQISAINQNEEAAITMYTMIDLGIYGCSDAQINSIMEIRKEIAASYLINRASKPINESIDWITSKVSSSLSLNRDSENALAQILARYYLKLTLY